MEVLKSTWVSTKTYTIKIVAIVTGIGVTMVILRPVRQAIFARIHGRSRNIYRKEMDDKRRELLGQIHELTTIHHEPLNIIEIGTGSVENAHFYPSNSEISCVTTRVYRKKELVRLAEEFPYINIVRESPESMTSFEDESVDVVISVLGLCTTAQTETAISEIKRVLKKGGRYYFFEHVAAKKLSVTSRLQRRYTVCWGMFFYGCNVNQNLSKVLKNAHFTSLQKDKFEADVDLGGQKYIGQKMNNFLNRALVYMIGPHLVGVAIK